MQRHRAVGVRDVSWGRGSRAVLGLAVVLVACWDAPPRQAGVQATSSRSGAERDIQLAEPGSPLEFEPDRLTKIRSALPHVEQLLESRQRESGAPGMAFAVVVDGTTVLERGYGTTKLGGGRPVTPGTVFRVGSVTKPLTALGVLVLASRGLVDLDAPAVTYLPELSGLIYPGRGSAPLTLRHLLTHTSGMPPSVSLRPQPSSQRLLRALRGLRLETEPGELPPRYSNFGFGVVGAIIERVAQLPFERFMQDEVLHPLGMDRSVWVRESVPAALLAAGYRIDAGGRPKLVSRHWRLGALAASGGLYSNLQDLARWVRFELSAYAAGDSEREVASSALTRGAHRPAAFFDTRATSTGVFASAAGLGWWVHRDCDFDQIVIKDGATQGYSASVLILPDRGVALVGLSSLKLPLNDTLKQAARVLLASGGLSRRTLRPSPVLERRARELADLFTTWNTQSFNAVFTREFREQVTHADFHEWMSWQRRTLGGCQFGGFVEVRSPNDASWISKCDKGIRRFQMPLADTDAGRFDSVASVAIESPGASVMHTVRQALAGGACEPDDPTCSTITQALSARGIAAPCSLASIIDGNGVDVAGLELRCGGRELRLWMKLSEGVLKSAIINDVHAATRCVK